MYIFKYHPDNFIYINGLRVKSYDDFIADFPDLPIIQGHYFEYRNENEFDEINSEGHHIPNKVGDNAELINAIDDFFVENPNYPE